MQHTPECSSFQIAPISNDDVVLQRVLYRLGLVDSPPEESFDKFTRLVKNAVDVPVALVSFVRPLGTGQANAAFTFFLPIREAR